VEQASEKGLSAQMGALETARRISEETIRQLDEEASKLRATPEEFHAEKLKKYRFSDKRERSRKGLLIAALILLIILLTAVPIYMSGKKDLGTSKKSEPPAVVSVDDQEASQRAEQEAALKAEEDARRASEQEAARRAAEHEAALKADEDARRASEQEAARRAAEEKAARKAPEKEELVIYAPPEAEATVHTVVWGDNLWNICKRYAGDPWKYPEVAKKNRIRNPDLIYPGQKIRIEPLKNE